MKEATILTVAFMFFLSSCTCTRDPGPKTRSVKVTLIIKNDKNELLSGANVYLFPTQTAYEFGAGNFTGKGSIDSTVSADGRATVFINSSTKYYLYINYYDPVRKLYFTNDGYVNTINELPQNIDVTAEIRLTPTSANVGFYSFGDNQFPIQIIINADTLVLNAASATAPTNASANNMALKTITKGKNKYYAKNALGCVWTGTFSARSGEFIPIRLQGCELGTMVFWTNSTNRAVLPIAISINGENFGSVTSTLNSYGCGNDLVNTLYAQRTPGAYSYVALSADRKCAWQGMITLKKDTCASIFLETCK